MVAKGPLVSDEIELADHVLFNGYTGDKVSVADSGFWFVVPEPFIVAKMQNSDVILIDMETVKRLIQERFGELMTYMENSELERIEKSLIDRIDTLTRAEGFMF